MRMKRRRRLRDGKMVPTKDLSSPQQQQHHQQLLQQKNMKK